MRAGNFNPEWGYLALSPSFARRARLVLVAAAVGATAGAGVVSSWVSHPATETSVAARTLVGPVEAASARDNTPAQVAQTSTPSPTEKQRPPSLALKSAHEATKESSASATTKAPQGISALVEAPTATDNLPAQTAVAATPAAAKAPIAIPAPIKKKATKKPYVTSRYASRSELFGLEPGQYYMSGSLDEYYTRGGQGRDSGRWGGRRYQDW
jgi:hypothetical protein